MVEVKKTIKITEIVFLSLKLRRRFAECKLTTKMKSKLPRKKELNFSQKYKS
jgi:hypothetical protein